MFFQGINGCYFRQNTKINKTQRAIFMLTTEFEVYLISVC